MSRVLFAGGGTGGHLYPALALADAMQAESRAVEVEFVGARRGVEATVLPRRGVPHTLLPMEPVYRSRPWRNWRLVPAVTRSFAAISALFRRYRPQLVVGTGGYASAPACLYAVVRRVPMAVQEQNALPGATTRLLARYARQVHLGFPEAEKKLRPGRRTRVFALGNPIRPPDRTLNRLTCRESFGLGRSSTVVLVVGGSQGARAINEVVMGALEQVAAGTLTRPAGLELLWATGPANYDALRERLDRIEAKAWAHIVAYIDDMPRALAAADIAISRAGAMMTAELLAWGVPSLLVPLPTAAADHQTRNARALEAAGAALCLEESTLTPDALWQDLIALAGHEGRRARMNQAATRRARPDAARDIARELLTLVGA
jgi:UDP-N-acetylglucosamine--N-acetylmuramyl-(pentapeptide) pyrophosphoryl-undecaprenol N-acetylglucosamine transferase